MVKKIMGWTTMQTQAQSQAGTGETHMGNWEWVDLEQANEKGCVQIRNI
jgi:hypothetical protein